MDFWGEMPDDQAYVIYNLTFYHDGAHWKLGAYPHIHQHHQNT